MRRRLLVLALPGLLALGCRSSTSPITGAVAGRYVAVSVDGKQLPVTSDSTRYERVILYADTLELDGLGNARRAYTVRLTIPSLAVDSLAHREYRIPYHVSDGSIWLGYPCPPNADCAEAPGGTLTGTTISILVYDYGLGVRTLFARMAPAIAGL